jgi:hypothetical protein
MPSGAVWHAIPPSIKTGSIGSIELSKNLKLLEQHPGRLEFFIEAKGEIWLNWVFPSSEIAL